MPEEDDSWATVTTKRTTSSSSLAQAASSSLARATTNNNTTRNPPRRGSDSSFREASDKQRKGGKRSKSFNAPQRTQSHAVRPRSHTPDQTSGGRKVPPRSQSYHPGNKTNNNNNSAKNNKSKQRPKALSEISLYNTPGCGDTPAQKAVLRYSADALLSVRMQFVDSPEEFEAHEKCRWKNHDRVSAIQEQQTIYYNYEPLNIDNATRWKSSVMGDSIDEHNDTTAATLQKIKSILNKMSWTKLDKLTMQFLHTLGSNIAPELVQQTMELVVGKAILEPHFAELYAVLCHKLTNVHKAFKKALLSICQEQFAASKSIGLMQFIGELYVLKLIKNTIILSCCQQLLDDNEDEAKLEAFCKLMTTIGKTLDEDDHTDTTELWTTVHTITNSVQSQRIKFLLEAVLELKENNWVNIRHQAEKATTLSNVRRKSSKVDIKTSGNLRRSVSTDGMPKVASRGGLRRVQSEAMTKPEFLEPKECAKKMESILKEYFINDLVDDAIQNVDELVGVGSPGCVVRASAVIEAGIFLVLEQKDVHVRKFCKLLEAWPKLPMASLGPALRDPLEFLRDIEIDAPKAADLFAMMYADWMRLEYIRLDELLNAPEPFQTDGRPADLCKQILRHLGGEPTPEDLKVVAHFLKDEVAVEEFLSS